jgi:hypothetical protein
VLAEETLPVNPVLAGDAAKGILSDEEIAEEEGKQKWEGKGEGDRRRRRKDGWRKKERRKDAIKGALGGKRR